MEIKRAGVTIATVIIDKKSVHSKKLMEEDLIKLSFTLESPILFEIGDYIELPFREYKLFSKPNLNQKSDNEFVYSMEFKGKLHEISRANFLLDKETNFYLTESLSGFISHVGTQGARFFGTGNFFAQIIESSVGIKTILFDNLNLLEAIIKICDEYDVEFTTQDSTINNIHVKIYNRVNTTISTAFRYKEAIRSVSIVRPDKGGVITRLYGYGSKRNIDSSYGSKRLMVTGASGGSPAYRDWRVSDFGLHEGIEIFEDIYPRRTGSITNIVNSGATWKFRDTSMDFDLNSYLITEPARINFTSGSLSGYEFKIVAYDNAISEFEISTFTDDQDLTLPNATIKPLSGDTYVLHNIKLPASYVSAAEVELTVATVAKVKTYARENSEISCILNPVWFRDNNEVLKIGQEVLVSASHLGIPLEARRIVQISQSLVNGDEYSVKISYERITPRLKNIEAALLENKRKIQETIDDSLTDKFIERD